MARKSILSVSDEREIIARYTDGAGIVQLAREYRCRTSRINEIVGKSNVKRRMLTANTPIEQRLQDALMAAGIGFTTQKRLVGRYVVDISIHQSPVVIEADGARHHAGSKAMERDTARDSAHEAAGYRVFRFTGSQINADAVKCIQEVIDACGLAPDEQPVYDIRTKFSGVDHPRWVGQYELTCKHCGETFHSPRAGRKYCCREHFILGAVKGKPKSAAHSAKISEANRRRIVSDETKAKISAARSGKPGQKGKEVSPETRAKISKALKGRRQSDETRAKKSEAHLGKQHTPETRAKISEALKGKPKSAEHRANLSSSRKREPDRD